MKNHSRALGKGCLLGLGALLGLFSGSMRLQAGQEDVLALPMSQQSEVAVGIGQTPSSSSLDPPQSPPWAETSPSPHRTCPGNHRGLCGE